MKEKIQTIYPGGRSYVYSYTCLGKGGLFSFPVKLRYHMDILENDGYPIGREVEFDNGIDPPILRFPTKKGENK
jgi:hypothetical protein